MSFISKKLSFVLLFCSWCVAAAITFGLNYALIGPKLSPVYDILLNFRASPPVSGEILLIETDEVIEPGDMFSVLMTLSEMGASNLLVEVPQLGTGSGMAETGLEFSYRINDEFTLLGKNIRNLFEAIRLGLVSPADSPDYVENLVELTERGRDRLNAAIIRQDEAGSALAAQAAEVFGRAMTAQDLRAVPVGEIPWYSRPQPDRDGVLRRIAPVTETEHIVYLALMPRWKKSTVEINEAGSFMVNTFESQGEEAAYQFPLDRHGNILVEKQRIVKDGGFRRLTLNHFRDYDQTGKVLARLLKDAESLGIYTETIPERIPLILFEYAENLKEELLKAPSETLRARWIRARAEYFTALDDFLYGISEHSLVNGYEEIIASEGLNEKGVIKLQNLRDELIRAFAGMREMHRELIGLRALLAEELNSSLCIMGPERSAGGTGIPESSALLANTLLTGHCVTPAENRYVIIFSLAASFLALLCIHTMGPVLLLVLGLFLSLLCGAAFGVQFIVNAYWIDPFISMAACMGGTLFLTLTRFCISYGRKLRFRLAYAGSVNSATLRRLIRKGRPLLNETLCSHAVIIAAKNSGMSGREDRETALEAARAAAEFRQKFSRIFKRSGALVLGFENDTGFACFGSPPERICGEEILHPAVRTVACIRKVMNDPVSKEWSFGLESGECAFSWSDETGYTANGKPVVRARILASLASRYHARAVIGESAREDSNVPVKKLASLSGEHFYELPGR
ncbi:MAG: hypothetical protein LBG95_07765 [Treponema sp.]|nr:hypothetical protein [Treponema sp.]